MDYNNNNLLNKYTFNRPFLYNISKRAFDYHTISCKVMQHRIDHRMKNWDAENPFLDELEEICKNATEEELAEIEKLPRMWWFQYCDENGVTQKSELDVYPISQCFVKQRPYLLGDDVSVLKGKPYFGDRTWKPHTPVMYLMIQEEQNGECNIRMVTMSNEHYDELERDYEFDRYAGVCPVFKKRKNDDK